MKKYVIIGGGVAGYTIAIKLATQERNKITLIEKDLIGGVCLNKGCIPTKYLLHNSNKDNPFLNQITNCKKTIDMLRENLELLIKNKKIEIIKDEAKILDNKTVILNKTKQKIAFDRLIIATGSKTKNNSFFEKKIDTITTDNILSLQTKPTDLIIIGGGYIGIEFATIFQKLGTKVVVVEKEKKILPEVDVEASKILQKNLESKGIIIKLGKEIESIEENVLSLKTGEEYLYDKILIAIGREANKIETNITLEEYNGFIKVNNNFETNQENIYAIGDVTGNQMFAHKAQNDAEQLANYFLRKKQIEQKYHLTPKIIFTNPTIIEIGEKTDYQVKKKFSMIGKSYCDNSNEGFLKIYYNNKKEIKGATIINKNAVEILSAMIIIISEKISAEKINEMIFGHPTSSEIIRECIKEIMLR